MQRVVALNIHRTLPHISVLIPQTDELAIAKALGRFSGTLQMVVSRWGSPPASPAPVNHAVNYRWGRSRPPSDKPPSRLSKATDLTMMGREGLELWRLEVASP